MNKCRGQNDSHFNSMAKIKISIVSPVFNAEKYILETVHSILNQTAVISGRVDLEYIIYDGNSTDNTCNLINELKSPYIKLFSESDKGMYDALAKGLWRATGDIVAYINAGDFYYKSAFDVVLDIFKSKKVKWLTGYAVHYSEQSFVTSVTLPFKYRRKLFQKGLYGPILPHVQQESTFWSSKLFQTIDFEKLRSLKNAGDFYLWHQFSTKEDLYIVASYLGGFKYHKDSLTQKGAKELGSDSRGANNLKEIKEMTRKATIFDCIVAYHDKLMLRMPTGIKKWLNKNFILLYDHDTSCWI